MNPAQDEAADHLARGRCTATRPLPGKNRHCRRNWLVAPALPRSCLRNRLDLGEGETHGINARLF